MPNWRTIDETDLAATISQSEIDAFRQDASLDGSDPVARLLDRTVATVRGLVSCNGSVRMCPVPQTLPLSLISPAMDYAAYDILKRLPVPVGEDRRKARERADALFEKIATGQMTVESYTEDGSIDEDKRPATSPMADDGARPILGGGMWSILAAAVLSLSSASARTFDWHLKAPRPEPVVFDAYHGETVRFNLVFPDALSNAVPVAIYYKTNGMDRAEWFPPVPGTVFAPSNDVGAAEYRFFIRCAVPDGIDYTANGTLRMLPSPGFEPSTVELPVKTLDFATIEVENAPWPTPGDIEDAVAAATNETLRAANAYTDGAIAAAGGVTPSMVTNIVNDIAPTPDYTTGNAQLVATIEATAPAPGDYANVSNRAVNALSRAEVEAGWWSEWTISPPTVGHAVPVELGVLWIDSDPESGWYFTVDDSLFALISTNRDASILTATIYGTLVTATRDRFAGPMPTKPSDIGAASTNDVQLAPVYSQTPTFSEWTFSDVSDGITDIQQPVFIPPGTGEPKWSVIFDYEGEPRPTTVFSSDEDATNIVFVYADEGLKLHLTATRTRTDIIGYTLGDQTNSVVASTNAVAAAASDLRDGIAAAAAAATNHTDSAVSNITAVVSTWEGFLDGSNVVFSITNYLSGAYNLDAAKLRILELRDGEYREVYNSRDEILLHVADATGQVFTAVNAAIVGKADKDWGKYTSSGGEAPSNTVYMTAPNTVFAGGLEYERVAVGQGAICVLTTKGAPTWTQGDEGTFKFQDDGGTNYFGFAKTDSYTIGANTDGITVSGGLVTLTYNVTMSGRPCVWYKSSLNGNAAWEQLNTPDGEAVPGASHAVTWEANPPANTQVCYINVSGQAQGFFKATIEVAGEAKFLTNMPADLSGGIMCTNTATGVMGVIKPTYNGSAVSWAWSVE